MRAIAPGIAANDDDLVASRTRMARINTSTASRRCCSVKAFVPVNIGRVVDADQIIADVVDQHAVGPGRRPS